MGREREAREGGEGDAGRMSIDRIKGSVAFFCDLPGCEEGIETGERDFIEAKDHAKAEGWQFRKRDPEGWKQFCCDGHAVMDYRGQSLVAKD